MKEEGRTQKTVRNTYYSLIYKLVEVLMTFVLRTIFIRTLGTTYLGVQGLFSNILTVLSLFEAGIGSATVFSLYAPLAANDHGKVAALMRLFRKTYNTIGVLIAILGISLTPLLKYIVNLDEPISNLYLIYFLTIVSTSITYFFSYRRTLLIADQRSDINTKNQILFKFTRFILLSAVLLITRNFIVYLVVDIINTFASNLQISSAVKTRYEYIENREAVPLTNEEKKTFVKYMSAGTFSKIGQTVVTSTDSILISVLIGTEMVGVCSNYNLVFSNLDIFVYILFSNLTAAIGNYAVKKNKDEAYRLFKNLWFVNYLIVSVITVCVFCLTTPFIKIWVGETYVLHENIAYVMAFNFYVTAMCNAVGNFLASRGEITYKNRFRPLIEAVVNLTVSIALIKLLNMGLLGVYLGTTVCYIIGRMWQDPHTLYKYWFEKPFSHFIITYLKKMLIVALMAVGCKYIVDLVFLSFGLSFITWVLSGFICVVICTLLFFVFFRRTKEFEFLESEVKMGLAKIRSYINVND